MLNPKSKITIAAIFIAAFAALFHNGLIQIAGAAGITALQPPIAFFTFSPAAEPMKEEAIAMATITWDGGGATNNWSEPANWSSDTVPLLTDSVIFDGTSTKDVTIDVNITTAAFNINAGYTGTISQGVSEVTINGIFTQADGVFSGGNATIDLNNNFSLSGGTFTASGENTFLGGNFTVSGTGSFEPNGGTAVFDGDQITIDVLTNEDFDNFHINLLSASSRVNINIGKTVRVNGDLLLTNGQLFELGTLEAFGEVTIAPTFDGGNGDLRLSGNAVRTVTIPALGRLPGLTADAPNTSINTSGTGLIRVSGAVSIISLSSFSSGTSDFAFESTYSQSGGTISNGSNQFTFNSIFTQSGGNFSGGSGTLDFRSSFIVSGGTFTASSGNTVWSRNFTVSGTGSFEPNGGQAIFDDISATIDVLELVEFDDFQINKNFNTNSLTVAAGDTVRVNGDLVLSRGNISGTGTLESFGGLTISINFGGGTGRLGIGGNAARTISIPAPLDMPNLTVNAPNVNIDTIGADTIFFESLTVQNVNSLTNGTSRFRITNAYNQSGGNVTGGSAFIRFDNTFTQTGGSFSCAPSCAFLGNMTLSGGDFTASPGNDLISNTTISANLTVNGGNFIANGGKVVFNSRTFFDVNPSGSVDFNNVELNSLNGLFPEFDSTLRVNGTLTLTNGFISSVSSLSNGTIEALGPVNIASTFDGGDGILSVSGNATRTITIPSPVTMSRIVVNAPNTTINTTGTGTITFRRTDILNVASMTNGAADFTFSAAFTQSGGIFNGGSGLLTFGSTFALSGGTFNAGSGNLSAANTFTQSGGAFNGNDATLDFTGVFTLSGGTFTASSGNTNFNTTLNVNGTGVFEHNNGTVRFIGGGGSAFNINNIEEFNNVEINKSNPNAAVVIAINDIMSVSGIVNLIAGQLSSEGNNARLEAFGDVNITSAFNGLSGNLHILGNATRTITIPSPSRLMNLTINAPSTDINTTGSGVIEFSSRTIIQNVNSMTNGSAEFVFGSQYEQTGGAFTVGSGNITFGGTFTQSGGTFTGSSSTLEVVNVFTVSGGTFTASSGNTNFNTTFNVSGTGNFEHNNGTVRFIGGGGSSFNINNIEEFNNVEINKSSPNATVGIAINDIMRVTGTASLIAGQLSSEGIDARMEAFGDVSISTTFAGGSGNLHILGDATRTITIPTPASLPNLTVNAPNVDINTSGNGIVDFGSRTVVQNVNSMTNGAAAFAFSTSDQYQQSGGTFNVGSGNITFGSLFTLSGGTFTGSDSTLQFTNVFTVSGGTFTASSGNTNFVQAFNVSGTGVFEHNNGTARFISSSGTVDVNESEDFNNVEIDKSSTFVALGLGTDDIMRIRGNLTLTNGQISTAFGNARFEAFGDVTISATFAGGSGNLHYVGTNNQTYTNNGGNNPSSIFRIDKPSGILTAATDLILPSNTGMVINRGTLYLANGSDLTAGGAVTGLLILANGRLVSDSSTTIRLGGNISNGGVVDLRGGGTCPAEDTILIRSTGAQRSWTGLGTNRLVNVDVQNMGGTGTKTVFSGTDSGSNNASWVFDSGCPTGLTLSPLTASVQTGGTQSFTASGGFSPYTYSIFTNNSGGSIDPFSGLYNAGKTAGVTDTIRVTDSFGDSTDATVNTFGAADRIVFTVQPGSTTAGQTISAIQVAVQDQFGNTVLNSTAAITLSISNNPNSGTLSGTVTKNAVNGIATFSDLSIDRAGAGYTIQAVSGGLNSATSDAFDINVGAATQLAFTVQPSDANPTAIIAPPVQVTVLDALGNTVTTASDPITIAIGNNPSSGTLSGTLIRSASNGIAVFDDLNIDNAGIGYTLSVSSGVLSGATSDAFNIANPFEVTNTEDTGSGSLRQAILNANATAGQQTISFNISGTAPFVIAPLTNLPDITDSLILDATTQAGFSGTPLIKLDGSNLPTGIGFRIMASNSTVRGFILTRFRLNAAIWIQASFSKIAGNHIGVFTPGQTDNNVGILIGPGTANGNTIGGTSASDRNVISGNRAGINIAEGANSNNVLGNFIGTDVNGTSAAPNSGGLGISSNENIIGGNSASSRNVISGNEVIAIGVGGDSNQITGNFIGTDVTGTSPLPNFTGISIVKGNGNTIGSISSGFGNVIAYNSSFAVRLSTSQTISPGNRNSVRGNSIHPNGISFGTQAGLTPNDVLDPDSGPNDLQNSPVLNPIIPLGGSIQVSGSLNSIPSKPYNIDIYRVSPGKGEYLTTVNVTTDAGGLTGFSVNIPLPDFIAGSVIRVTATDEMGNTSEFGQGRTIPEFAFGVSGTIRDALGNALRDVVVREETTGLTKVTNSGGGYSFGILPGGENYTIRPSAIGKTFSPLTRTITNHNSNTFNQNFTGTQTSFSISGEVTSINSGVKFLLSGATVTLSGTANRTTTTDLSGRYFFNSLPSGGNYVVTVSKDNFSFSPSSAAINNLNSNRTADFGGTTTLDGVGRVVFRSKSSKSILVMNGDGTGKKVLFTVSSGFVSAPSFSSDGRRIVFTQSITSASGSISTRANVMNFDGSDLTSIIGLRPVDPRFSPDGTKVIFGERNRIIQSNFDGSVANVIFTASGTSPITKPDWSPDGSKIVFSQSGRIFTINANGTGLTQLTNTGNDFHPRFSPNGERIAFIRQERFELGRLFVMNADGNLQNEVSPSRSYKTFSWSPDGTTFGLDSADFRPNPSTSYSHLDSSGLVLKIVSEGIYDSDWSALFAPSTPTGSSVQTTLGAVNVTFNNVSGGGQTTVVPIDFRLPPDIPVNFVLGNQAYEISTTANVSPPIQVCFTIQGSPTLTQFNTMQIRHLEGGVLVDRTVSRNFTTKQICASVSSLSPFVLAEQIDINLPSITGLIQDSNGNPMSGVSVSLTGTEERQTETNSDGSFKFVNLTPNGNYNVSPKNVGHIFEEYNTNFIDVTGEETVFFEGTAAEFQITGTVRDGAGNPLVGVPVELDGSQQGSVDTDANGEYTFAGLPADGTYFVTPQMPGFVFRPGVLSISALTSNVSNADFEAFAPTAAAVTIAGRVMSPDGNGINRAEVTLYGQSGLITRTITNPFGYFEFDAEAGSSYIVTVSHKTFRFVEPSRVVNPVDDINDLNFISDPRE